MKKERFRPVSPHVSFPEMESRILSYWRDRGIVEKGLAANEGSPEWVFYEGPPTANAKPHVGNVETQVFKDIYPRFQVMRGKYVHRKAGWDCHGLPVELEVEKELGLTSKREIEDYGIERFNQKCRYSVLKYVEAWEQVSERIGFWINLNDAYRTMDPEYVESVWWSLKQLHQKGLLFQDYRSGPYCPRCETTLSDHELNQPGAYKTVKDQSLYVRLPLVDEEADLLIWTTTPWTLPSNLAAAIHPGITYVRVETESRPVILAQELISAVLGEGAKVLETIASGELEGRRYEPPFRYVESEKPAWFVVAEEFVTIGQGTGIVHLAPAFGADDFGSGRRHGLPLINLVDRRGVFVSDAGLLAGLSIKEANPKITADLEQRGLLFRQELYEHNYPHCWRCKTALLYYAKSSWYVRTTERKDELLAQNEKTNWYPSHIKDGRYGEWLQNNVDWALSRDRYWGTPLPIWRCPNGHDTVVGSRTELSEVAGEDLSSLDPHRPFVDEVVLACQVCTEEARRVPEVVDVWYDSGSMPFAQWGYPHRGEGEFERNFPADFIAEALDQTRGWFYSLMAVSTLLFGRSSYRNVLCLGLFLDEEGQKMSKSVGNVVDPWDLIDRYGADALRWYMFTSGSPWADRRIGPTVIEELMRRYLVTLWNTYSFFVTYANIDDFKPPSKTSPQPSQSALDRWILSELNDTTREVTESLEDYDALRAGRRLDQFVDDLSNWYVRRSRRRFWKSESDVDKSSAYVALHHCLVTVAKLTAPFTPFIAEEIFTNLTESESVHLEDWPSFDRSQIDLALIESMRTARHLTSLGRAARNEAKVRTRQPLAKALLVAPDDERDRLAAVLDVVAEELNVKKVELVDSLEELLHYELRPNFRTLGPRFGKKMGALEKAISSANPLGVREELARDGRVRFVVEGEQVWLDADDVEVRATSQKGYGVAFEGRHAVALDLDVSEELRIEGIARELARALNDARRSAGLEISDRIALFAEGEADLNKALRSWRVWIGSEVLVEEWLEAPPPETELRELKVDAESLRFAFARKKNVFARHEHDDLFRPSRKA